MSQRIDEVEVWVMEETPKAFRMARFDLPGTDSEWFPKSQVSFKTRNIKTGKAIAQIPDWLLQNKKWTR